MIVLVGDVSCGVVGDGSCRMEARELCEAMRPQSSLSNLDTLGGWHFQAKTAEESSVKKSVSKRTPEVQKHSERNIADPVHLAMLYSPTNVLLLASTTQKQGLFSKYIEQIIAWKKEGK